MPVLAGDRDIYLLTYRTSGDRLKEGLGKTHTINKGEVYYAKENHFTNQRCSFG